MEKFNNDMKDIDFLKTCFVFEQDSASWRSIPQAAPP